MSHRMSDTPNSNRQTFNNNVEETVVVLEMVKFDEHDAIWSILLKEMGRATYVQ